MNRRSFLRSVGRLGAAIAASPLAALLPFNTCKPFDGYVDLDEFCLELDLPDLKDVIVGRLDKYAYCTNYRVLEELEKVL